MQTQHAEQAIREVVERLQSSGNARTVFGDPVEAQGKTVIPVAQVRYGFGGGMGSGKPDSDNPGSGLGGGGGIVVNPMGVLEITPISTQFVPFDRRWHLLVAAAVGALAGYWLGRGRRRW
jgi:uncharacterized spore protein YtfJ